MSILEQLNNRQQEAASCTDSHVRIIADAGSGKTRVVTVRIAYLIDECHVYPNRILAITFTNKAAREMCIRDSVMRDRRSSPIRHETKRECPLFFLHEKRKTRWSSLSCVIVRELQAAGFLRCHYLIQIHLRCLRRIRFPDRHRR